MNPAPVTLQISLAPSDYRFAPELLPHQLRALAGQVDEVLLTVDLHRSRGRFADAWAEGRQAILELAQATPGARVVEVDYSPDAMRNVSRLFFAGASVPAKDFRGGPFYAYFFGLAAAHFDHVLHLDSDMLLGGGSQTWVAEAVSNLAIEPDVLVCAPLPGPPTLDGQLHSQSAEPDGPHAFRFRTVSTRIFLLDRARFRQRIGALRPQRPPVWRNVIKAWVEGNPAADLPEHLFSQSMQERGLLRRDFLGTAPGLWSLHPPYRCAAFYACLPELIRRVESGDIPVSQRGDHDINRSLVDWSEALERLRRNRWWKRMWRHSLSRLWSRR